ncbi:MAG: chemotaxis protein CheW [Pseudomonadales bacterium]
MSEDIKPFALLVEIASRSLSYAKPLPAQIDITPTWTGVGFTMAGQRMVAPMSEIAELLTVPGATKLPGVEDWVKGVANIRGRLLPLIDLEAFFGLPDISSRRKRVLSVETRDLYTGLVVGEVFGMQHFPVDCFNPQAPAVAKGVDSFVAGCYEVEGTTWTVFSPFLLSQDVRFLNAAGA